MKFEQRHPTALRDEASLATPIGADSARARRRQRCEDTEAPAPEWNPNPSYEDGESSVVVFIEILFPVLLIIGSGAVFSRLSRSSMEPLTLFSLYVSTPALVFCALLNHPVPAKDLVRLVGLVTLYTTAMWAIAEAVARALRLEPALRRAFSLGTVSMNVGNYGLPLVRFALGQSVEPFSVLVFVIFNIPLATWAIWVAAGGGSAARENLRQSLKIPIFHATVAPLLLTALGWTVPAPLLKGLGLLGEASIPLLLVILGMQLERTRAVEAPFSVAAAVVLRLAVSPFLAWGLSGWLGYSGMEQKVIVLQTSTPAAVLPLLYALRFNCRPDWLASNLLFSTLASAATLTAILWWIL